MAEHHSGPVEVGAQMDYAEHDKSYNLFINGAKYGTMVIACLLISMAFGFFTPAGFISSVILFLVLNTIGIYLLRG